MRNICLLLLLLNLMVLAYQRWILQPADNAQASTVNQDIPWLQLADPKPDAATDRKSEVAAAQSRCSRLGPFASKDDAQTVQRELLKRGALVEQSSDQGDVWVGHWVQVRDQGSRAKAEVARDALVAENIDTYILPGEDSFALSLGIYRKRSSAEGVLRRARQLGYSSIMVDRFQPGTIFWLQVTMPDGGALQPGEFQSDSGQILRTELIACEST